MKSDALFFALSFLAGFVTVSLALINWQLYKIRRIPQSIMDFAFGYEKAAHKAALKETAKEVTSELRSETRKRNKEKRL